MLFSCSWSELHAQDFLPQQPPCGNRLKEVKSLGEWHECGDIIRVKVAFPEAFCQTGPNVLLDSLGLLQPVLEHLRLLRVGLSEDTVRIVHIGDSHVRGHIYPQTTGTRLTEAFGAVSYIDKGVNGATCLTFTHPRRIDEVANLKPELLILSFGTNESHNQRYNAHLHYHQLDELVKSIRIRLPDVPILLTTPPGAYESFRKKKRRRMYVINPRTSTAVATIHRYAKEHRLLVWDLYEVVGGKSRACLNWATARLMRPDHVHFLPEGYILQGNLLYQALITAYNDYVSY
ncbi:periplasmic protein [gut metagenome]|uniref:Periplasmic protein n=1 Tax=gut metagenome TaxID=749906 RepID=J9H592_9ZZZZ